MPAQRRLRGARPPLAGLLLAALTLLLAACGGGTVGEPQATTGVASAAAPTATAQSAPSATATPAATTGAAAPPGAAAATTRATPPRTAATRPAGAATTPQHTREQPTPQSQPSTGSAAEPAPTPAAAPRPAAIPPHEQADPAPAAPTGTPIDELADLRLTERDSPAHYFQAGTVTGTYAGTMAVEVRITSKGVIVDFTATLAGGTISGRAIAVAVLDGTTTPGLRGTAAILHGTGRFAGIHGRRLKVTGRAKPDGSHATVHLVGSVAY